MSALRLRCPRRPGKEGKATDLGYVKQGLLRLILTAALWLLGLFILLPLVFCWSTFDAMRLLLGQIRVDARGVFLK